ncbi:radical SAM protein [Bradyrhizobium forestalis]|uniref:Radical SAM protein n=1 Tax=Bradyrhizobium forestalis TaxID=1419263 RepID=A0A2M8R0C9_9BRAD|nr:radical SAM protein [Bradyrhizobium forestalis]PJG51260.1 radical SAM protein [Bradyrhizobium forestalis]
MFRVALIYPPGGDPRAPRLPLPALAAALRTAGVHVSLFDLDIEGVLDLLRPERLLEAGERVARRAARSDANQRPLLERTAGRAPELAETIPAALRTIRDPAQFCDPVLLNQARERLYNCLDLVSLASERNVRYQTEILRYDVEGVDPSRFSDLLQMTADPTTNLFQGHWDADVFRRLDAGNFNLIGISLTLRWQIMPGLSLARQLRRRGFPVVLGGTAIAKVSHRLPHLPEFFTQFADAVVIREGETALVELVNQLQGAHELEKVPNLLYMDQQEVRATKLHIENYATLATPDFDGMPLGSYLSPHLVLPVMVGKGCYHDECTFCDIPFINRVSPKRYRTRPAERLASDIDALASKYDCRHFLLADEALPPRVLDRIADALVSVGRPNLAFSGYARLEPGFTPELCSKLAAVGLRRLYFGLESADQRTLDGMQKGIRIENAATVLNNCRDAGIRFHVFSMIGFPGEDHDSARRTIDFFAENTDLFDDPGNTFDIHELEILTDTPYFSEADKYGIRIDAPVEDRDFLFGVGTNWENTRGLTRAEIAELLGEASAAISKRFASYHAWPPVVWPAQEEWSLIYADRYYGTRFPHRVGVPDHPDGSRYRLAWNRAAIIERGEDKCVVTSRRNSVSLDPLSFWRLGEDPRYRPGPEILSDLAGVGATSQMRADLKALVVTLVRQRLLDVVTDLGHDVATQEATSR